MQGGGGSKSGGKTICRGAYVCGGRQHTSAYVSGEHVLSVQVEEGWQGKSGGDVLYWYTRTNTDAEHALLALQSLRRLALLVHAYKY